MIADVVATAKVKLCGAAGVLGQKRVHAGGSCAALMETILSLIKTRVSAREVTTAMTITEWLTGESPKQMFDAASVPALRPISAHCVHCQQRNKPMAVIYVFSVYTLHTDQWKGANRYLILS